MIEFLKNIIPRIQKYSKGLDKIEVFVDKTEPWIYVDENGGQHQYIFLREDKRLIMIFNGVTKVGKWELLPTNQLLIDRISDLITLDHLFVEKALLVLKKSGTDDLPFVLISREHIPDLDVDSYLEKFENEQKNIGIPDSEKTYKILNSGILSGPAFYLDIIIKTENGDILSGTYNTTKFDGSQFVVIENNKIVSIYYRIEYFYNGQKFDIKQCEYAEPHKGDILIDFSHLKFPVKQYFEIKNISNVTFKIQCNQSGSITNIEDEDDETTLLVFYSFAVIIFLLIFFSIISKAS